MNWRDWLYDHFHLWRKDQKMTVEELMVLDQFLTGVLEELRVWLRERKPESLNQAAELAYDYSLARSRSAPLKPVPSCFIVTRVRPVIHPKDKVGRSQTNWRVDKKCFKCGKMWTPPVDLPWAEDIRSLGIHQSSTVRGMQGGGMGCKQPQVPQAWNT